MEGQAPQMFSVDQLKEKLGKYYISKIHAKARPLSYKQVRLVLEGNGSSKETIHNVMRAAQEAISEKEELDLLNAQIKPQVAA